MGLPRYLIDAKQQNFISPEHERWSMNDDLMELDEEVMGENLDEVEMAEEKVAGIVDRRRVESKLEEMRLERNTAEYDFV